MNKEIQKILEISINAPSGSNSQPWKFLVKDSQIDVLALPEKDHPILNYHNRGTWVAHGALVENILISASALGYTAELKVFPDNSNPNITARILLVKSDPQNESLFDDIPLRATNRKPYSNTPLTAEQKKELMSSIEEIGGNLDLRLTDDRKAMKILGEAGSVNEIVMLENEKLHKLFFDEIVWTKDEEAIKKSGLYLKTMELKPPQQTALRIFRKWPVMNVLNKFKVARVIAKGNAKIYASSGAMGVIICKDQDGDFIQVGRLMERLWLKATQMKLSFHIITGVLFFHQKIKSGDVSIFSKKQINLIESAYEKIRAIFDIKNGVIAIMFRIGGGGEPSARSIKSEPDIKFN